MNMTTSEHLNRSIKSSIDRNVFTLPAYQFSMSISVELESFKKVDMTWTVVESSSPIVVESSSPIVVFFGNDWNILNGQGFCDH